MLFLVSTLTSLITMRRHTTLLFVIIAKNRWRQAQECCMTRTIVFIVNILRCVQSANLRSMHVEKTLYEGYSYYDRCIKRIIIIIDSSLRILFNFLYCTVRHIFSFFIFFLNLYKLYLII